MEIAVIGTGNIGGTLGRSWSKAGHRVFFGSRDPSNDHVAHGTDATVVEIATAIASADVVVLAIPGDAVGLFASQHGDALPGKLVIDCANRMGNGAVANSHDTILAAVPDADYARAFNTTGVEVFQNPLFGSAMADVFYSAPETRRDMVDTLIRDAGLRPAYLGYNAHHVVDGALQIWFALARQRGRRVAFRVLDATDA